MDKPTLNFVISAPRSGSTWLTTALNHHPEIFATEQRLFGQFAEIWRNNDGTMTPRLTFDSFADAFSVHYFHEELGLSRDQFVDVFQKSFINFLVNFAARRKDVAAIIDKITPYPGTATTVVHKAKSICPNAKIIQLVRDGRDVVTSGTFDWLLKDASGTDRYEYFVEKKQTVNLNRFFDDAVITKWATNWRETVEVFESQPADLRIRYEDLKDDCASQLLSVYELLGVAVSDLIADQAATATEFEIMTGRAAGNADEPTAKARKGITGDWRNYFTRKDAEQFHDIAGTQLVELGYEPDPSWVQRCPNQLELSVG